MKQEKHLRKRTIAAICAVVLVAGGTAAAFGFRSRANAQAVPETEQRIEKTTDTTISAGGTVSSAQLSDTLGLSGTSVRLTVEEVLVESGDTVTEGTALYRITEDSLTKAEKTLRAELQTAEKELLEQQLSYEVDKNEAYALYQSELLLGNTAQTDYETGIAQLDSELQSAYSEYQDAQDTVNNTPSQVSSKQNEVSSKQSQLDSLQSEKNAMQEQVNNAKSAYTAASESYSNAAAEYNAAAGAVRYIGKALGMDVSGITLTQANTAQEQTAPAGNDAPAQDGDFSGMPDNMPEGGDMPSFDGNMPVGGMPSFGGMTLATASAEEDTQNEALKALYDEAYADYTACQERLSQTESDYRNAKSEYESLSQKQSEYSSQIKELQSSITSLNQEISSLNSTLSKAKSNLSKLRSSYNSLKASYDTDKLALLNTLNTDKASCENAEYHYEITCATLDEELAEAQESYDTAEENLRIFEELLTDGCICAQQDGTIYSLSTKANRSVDVSSPYAYYVDEESYAVTVELDQNDVTAVAIGDSVMIYSSETGITNGTITSITAGTSTSLADVRFNVTVTAAANSGLYYGQSVNVYFNAGDLNSGDFKDFSGGDTDGEAPERGSRRPDFNGEMPEGFDPNNRPDFGNFDRTK
ncbi:MAG: hypothetical protein K5695_14530 [Oscillospiraceae bacterium]|nr:hypothetical protein [Oscillospiraceae bacterium]